VVVGADRDAAREHDHVGLVEGGRDRVARGLLRVGHRVVADDARRRLGGERGERGAVGVVQLAGAERAPRGDELVARGEDRHARDARAGHGRPAGHHGHPDLGRAHARAGGYDDLARADVVTRRAQVAGLGHFVVERDRVAVDRDALDLDHGVGALGHRGAGRDADRLALADGDRGRRPGTRLANDAQRAARRS
jgi:hypothetical protein